MIQQVKTVFAKKFGSEPRLFRSPGRINIIGEHTDYNAGFVLPAAINKEMIFAVAPNTLNCYRFYALDLDEYIEIDYAKVIKQKEFLWANYLLGVIAQLQKKGINTPGVDVVIGSTIPIGAGVSSSAAMECGFLYALNALFSYQLQTIDMVKMAQLAEHEFAGVKCGIMDQFAVMFGKKNHVIKLDCRSHEYEYFPFDLSDYSILLCDTGVKHSLASSEYNLRRQECERGVSILQQTFPEVLTLRDTSIEALAQVSYNMSPKTYAKCSYVLEENERLLQACSAMKKGDLARVGRLMYGSHEGLQKKYEVSCPELDNLVAIAQSTEGALGSRMMGGGFGGCTISIIHKDAVEKFKKRTIQEYYNIIKKPAHIIEVAINDGTSEL